MNEQNNGPLIFTAFVCAVLISSAITIHGFMLKRPDEQKPAPPDPMPTLMNHRQAIESIVVQIGTIRTNQQILANAIRAMQLPQATNQPAIP